MAVNIADAVLGTPVTFRKKDCAAKMADVRASMERQQPNPQRRLLAEGFEKAFSLLEECNYHTRKVRERMEQQMLQMLTNNQVLLAQGFIAGLLFCRDTVKAGYEGLMQSLEHAFACVQEAMRHLQQFTRQQLQAVAQATPQ
jgi:hypothetical protein